MRRAVPLIALSLLLAGTGACADKVNDAGSPSPAVSRGPHDQKACDSAGAVGILAAFRLVSVALLLKFADADTYEDARKKAAANLIIVTTTADEAIATMSDVEIKAAITEIKTTIANAQTALGTAGSESVRLDAELDKATDELDTITRKLEILCPTASPNPFTSDGPMGRKETCKGYRMLGNDLAFILPWAYGELQQAGGDRTKVEATLKEVNPMIDEMVTRLITLVAKTTDSELRTALQDQVAELTKAKTALTQAARDSEKIKELTQNGPPGGSKAAQEKLAALCADN